MNHYLLEMMAKDYAAERMRELKEAERHGIFTKKTRRFPGFIHRFFLQVGKLLIAMGSYLLNRFSLPPAPHESAQDSFPPGDGCSTT